MLDILWKSQKNWAYGIRIHPSISALIAYNSQPTSAQEIIWDMKVANFFLQNESTQDTDSRVIRAVIPPRTNTTLSMRFQGPLSDHRTIHFLDTLWFFLLLKLHRIAKLSHPPRIPFSSTHALQQPVSMQPLLSCFCHLPRKYFSLGFAWSVCFCSFSRACHISFIQIEHISMKSVSQTPQTHFS